MRTSAEIYHRVRWDPRFDPARFVFGVEQRAAAVKRVPLPDFVPGGEIPWHRVLFVEAEGDLVWDRATGLDRIDASGLGRARSPRLLRPPFFTAGSAYGWHPVDGWRPVAADGAVVVGEAAGGAGHVRVLTWNTLWDRYDSELIHTGRRRIRLLAALEQCDADVIALQEVEAGLLAMLAASAWVRAGYTLHTDPRGNEVEVDGLLLLSRLPVRETGRHALGPHKALAAVTVETAGGPLVVATTHLSSDHSADGAARRRLELARIAEGIAAVDGALVLLGDFNEGGDAPAGALDLRDAWTDVRGGADRTPTFDPVGNPLAALSSLSGRVSRLDRVLVRPHGPRPTAAVLVGDVADPDGLFASDHYGVQVDFETTSSTPDSDEGLDRVDTLDAAPSARTAVAWIPPRELWPVIQDLRREHDPQIDRWPPHVNLLFGFVPESEFDAAAPLLAAAVAGIAPFPVRLDGVHSFGHRDDATVWLDPAVGAESRWSELRDALAGRFPGCRGRSEGFTAHLTLGRARDAQRVETHCAARLSPMSARVGELVLLSRRGDEPMRPRAVVTLGTGELRWLPETGDGQEAAAAARTVAKALLEPDPHRDAIAARTVERLADGLPDALVEVVGSRRMDCALSGADLDLVAAVPGRADLAELMRQVTESVPGAARVREVIGARVPGLRLTVHGLDVDLSVVSTGAVPPAAAVERRAALGEGAAIALSAVGDAAAVRAAVRGDRDGFARLARTVKAWARVRGLDSAPFGGLPGLAWSVLAARVVRAAAEDGAAGSGAAGGADAADLLQRFFATWAAWDWREAVALDAQTGVPVLPPAPVTVLTPSTPVRNCAVYMSSHGRDLLVEELYRAWEVTATAAHDDVDPVAALLEPPPLHRRHAGWALLTVGARSPEDFDRLLGSVRGRMMALLTALDGAGIEGVHAWPRPVASGPTSTSYAIGLGRARMDPTVLAGIARRWSTGLSGVTLVPVEGGEIPTLR